MLDRIEAMEKELRGMREQIEAQDEQSQSGAQVVALDTPEVRQAAQQFAEAIARAQGQTLPLRFAEGSSLPVLSLDNDTLAGLSQMGEMGGIGIAVVTAPATQAAGAAA